MSAWELVARGCPSTGQLASSKPARSWCVLDQPWPISAEEAGKALLNVHSDQIHVTVPRSLSVIPRLHRQPPSPCCSWAAGTPGVEPVAGGGRGRAVSFPSCWAGAVTPARPHAPPPIQLQPRFWEPPQPPTDRWDVRGRCSRK